MLAASFGWYRSTAIFGGGIGMCFVRGRAGKSYFGAFSQKILPGFYVVW